MHRRWTPSWTRIPPNLSGPAPSGVAAEERGTRQPPGGPSESDTSAILVGIVQPDRRALTVWNSAQVYSGWHGRTSPQGRSQGSFNHQAAAAALALGVVASTDGTTRCASIRGSCDHLVGDRRRQRPAVRQEMAESNLGRASREARNLGLLGRATSGRQSTRPLATRTCSPTRPTAASVRCVHHSDPSS